MFVSIDRLPQFNPIRQQRYRRRWDARENGDLRDRVLALIRGGAAEHFLQRDFEGRRLASLEDMYDLKGLKIFDERFGFPDSDTFKAIDFSHAQFYHSTFNNAVFNCYIAFARIYNCEFRRCIFSFNHTYGTTFEKCRFIECEFVENNTFTNCRFQDSSFENCFIPVRLFFDCSFDQSTRVGESVRQPFRWNPIAVDLKDRTEINNCIKEAYRAGGVPEQARKYFFLQMQAATRFNTASRGARWLGFCKEYLAGYGVRPFRVLAGMAGVLLLSSIVFSADVGLSDGILLAAGGLFTFGARADDLPRLSLFYRAWYIVTAFVGISLTALFVTVMANVSFREQ